MFLPWMSKLLLYFDLWGLFTQFNRLFKQSKFSRLIFILHIFLVSASSYLICKYLLRPVSDKLGTVNDVLKHIVLLFSYWLSIFELYLKRRTQNRFWHHVQHIDRHFCSHQRFSLANYMFNLKVYFCISAISYIGFLQRIISTIGLEFIYFWFPCVFVVLGFQNRSFYYLFYLEFVKHELKMIDHEISEIVNAYENVKFNARNVLTMKFHRNRFKWTRQYFESVHSLCGILNSVFGWSNVANILLSFHFVLTDINWLYWKILNAYQFSILGKTLWHISKLFNPKETRYVICFVVLCSNYLLQSTTCGSFS